MASDCFFKAFFCFLDSFSYCVNATQEGNKAMVAFFIGFDNHAVGVSFHILIL